MNFSNPEPTPSSNAEGFDSLDCQILIVDGPGDTTVRPPSPAMLAWFEKERARLAKLGYNLDGTPLKPTNANGPK